MFAAAVTRSWRSDPDRTDNQRLSIREALHALTRNASWQSHAESWRGSLAANQSADFIVLDQRVDWNEPWSLVDASIVRTVIHGDTIFEK